MLGTGWKSTIRTHYSKPNKITYVFCDELKGLKGFEGIFGGMVSGQISTVKNVFQTPDIDL